MTEYYIINPTGNITALVMDKGYSKNEYNLITQQILKEHGDVEQVGFVDFSGDVPYLRMSGDEFCGNATMSTAALFCKINGMESFDGSVEVYGVSHPIKTVVALKNRGYKCSVSLDKPKSIGDYVFFVDGDSFKLPVIDFEGISHIIAPFSFDRETAEKILKKYSNVLNLSAFGFMLFERKTFELEPVVYVKDCNTLFYENSCASGSCAVGAFLYERYNLKDEISLIQPGGSLNVRYDALNDTVLLDGNVCIINQYFR